MISSPMSKSPKNDRRRKSKKNDAKLIFTQINGNNFLPMCMENSQEFQVFYINSITQNKKKYKFKSNYISTTKYNFVTFVPKSFLLQFTRLPNVYFLFIAIIQSIPEISPLSSATAILPLVFVLIVSMLRELIEDISRYKYDKISNNRLIKVFKNNEFQIIKGQNIEIGELIVVNENREFPCDMILLDSSSPEGICYMETASLDGEKSLKIKMSIDGLKGKFYKDGTTRTMKYNNIGGNCICDKPNPELYKFDGKMVFNIDGQSNEYVLSNSQLLLKGAILRQTKQVIGIACYVGHNTKILLNSKNPKIKFSRLEILMSRLLIFIFIAQIIFCIICSIFHGVYRKRYILFLKYYIFPKINVENDSFISFFTYLLLLNTMIPISLIVTLEIVKVIQGLFIGFDCELYSFIRKKFCHANSISIIEELGKINYIFSDKTGTLTCNKMQFKYCVIGTKTYEYAPSSQEQINIHSNNKLNQNKQGNQKEINFKSRQETNIRENENNNKSENINSCLHNENIKSYNNFISIVDRSNLNYKMSLNFNNKRKMTQEASKKYEININDKPIPICENYMANKVMNNGINKEENYLINEFWHALVLANECLAIVDEEKNDLTYNGLSPDDIELVNQSNIQGFKLLPSPNGKKIITVGNEYENYKILNLLEFTSERKRMSIIVQNEKTNEIKIYTKGADSEIKKRLIKELDGSNLKAATFYTDYYSSQGFRTLFVAMKSLSQEQYNEFAKNLKSAELDLSNKNKNVNNCYNEIETNFILLGVTIVEDRLQDEVPEVIRDLRCAGIKIWMLTGDKIDTAENIAISCNLISKNNQLFKITPMTNKKRSSIYKQYKNSKSEKLNTFTPELASFINEYNNFIERNKENSVPFSIVIESSILGKILYDENKAKQFLKIAIQAKSCVCCRVSPLQKSLIVRAVKNLDKKNICLAIGDGGNDVSMLLEAHIGVGIHGEEGASAVHSSDFSIGEFKFLKRLLFFHGRNSLNRTSNMILYFFYKNFVFTILQFYFSFYNICSGQTIIDDWFITLFNLVFTSLPLAIQALTNFDVLSEDNQITELLMPYLYRESNVEHEVFSIKSISISLAKGMIYSLINFYFVIYSVRESPISTNGTYGDIWYCSLCLFSNIIFIVSISLGITQTYINWMFPVMMIAASFIIYYIFCLYVHNYIYFNSYCAIIDTLKSGKYYLILVLVSGICFMIDYSIFCYKILFSNQIYTELMIYKKNKKNYSSPLLDRKGKEINKFFMLSNQNKENNIDLNKYALESNNSLENSNKFFIKDLSSFNLKILNSNNNVINCKKSSRIEEKIMSTSRKKEISKTIKTNQNNLLDNLSASNIKNKKKEDKFQEELTINSIMNNKRNTKERKIKNHSIRRGNYSSKVLVLKENREFIKTKENDIDDGDGLNINNYVNVKNNSTFQLNGTSRYNLQNEEN